MRGACDKCGCAYHECECGPDRTVGATIAEGARGNIAAARWSVNLLRALGATYEDTFQRFQKHHPELTESAFEDLMQILDVTEGRR